jgi:hypothetical protein
MLSRFGRVALPATAVVASLIGAAAHAVEAVNARVGAPSIDLGDAVEWRAGDGGRLMVSAAADRGIVRRIEVLAHADGVHWAVFALANRTDERIERLIVVPRDQMAGSRVASIVASWGRPDRQASAAADIFRVTLLPRATVTFLAELPAERLPHIYLWEPEAYRATHDR